MNSMRQEYVNFLRQRGLTYKEIGSLVYGGPPHRARELVLSYERKLRQHKKSRNPFIRKLLENNPPRLIRILNCLRNHFHDLEKIDPIEIVNMGPEKLLKINNLGMQSLSDIAIALNDMGITENAHAWSGWVSRGLAHCYDDRDLDQHIERAIPTWINSFNSLPHDLQKKLTVSDEPCPACNDTGWYGDNGPGIKGNKEYIPCDQCTAFERAVRRRRNIENADQTRK